MKRGFSLLLVILFLLFFTSFNYANKEKRPKEKYVAGELIVKYKENAVLGFNQNLTRLVGSNIMHMVLSEEKLFKDENKRELSRIYKLKVSKNADIKKLAEEYSKLPYVEYAEPNYIYEILYQPDDSSFASQWGLNVIRANESWNITRGNSSVVIAIIDTGVDWDHPDLALNIWNNTDEIPDNGVDDDNNSYVDDVRGYDFVDIDNSSYEDEGYIFDPNEDYNNNDTNPMDYHGHGTHCAGIAAAVTNNSQGIAGVCWYCKIMPVRAGFKIWCPASECGVAGWTGILEVDDIAHAIRYAADNNASIISMSFGGTNSSTLQDAIDYAYSKNITLIAAAGNDGTSDKTNAYPAAYDNVIGVAATGEGDSVPSYSNYGAWVDVAAPGNNIYSTYYNDTYATMSGTSMAAPHVAGGAGLLLSYNSSLSQTEIRDILNHTGKVINFHGTEIPRIDLLSALSSFDKTPPVLTNNATNNTKPRKNDVVQFNITCTDNFGVSFYFFSWNESGQWINSSNGSINGVFAPISVVKNITATRGKSVFWKFYCNDTSNNWNMTQEWSFTVENTIPSILNLTLTSTDSLNRTNGSLVAYFDYFDVDNDTNVFNETRWYNNSKYVPAFDNITLIGAGNFSYNETWIFSIRVYDGYNWSDWYNSSSITILNTPPDKPILNLPENGSFINSNYTILNWSVTDFDNNTMSCYLYGGRNQLSIINITNNVTPGSYITYNWTNLSEASYYWRVHCDDGYDNSSNSTTYMFTVISAPVTHPTLVSVLDYDADGNIEINWSDDGNESGESYRIYRFTSNITLVNSSLRVIATNVSEGIEFFEDNTTTNGTRYYYVLITVDSNGNYNESIFSNCLSGLSNDTIKPKTASNITISSSGNTATLSWKNVSYDTRGNPDFHGLRYVIYYGKSFNSSKTLANESISSYKTKTVYTNHTTISVTSSGIYHFIITTLDDGNNANLTLGNNYGNASLSYTPPNINEDGGGGGGGGGGSGGGGGVARVIKKVNLEAKEEFINSGTSVKVTQGTYLIFKDKNNNEHIVNISKLYSDRVIVKIKSKIITSIFYVGDEKEFDVDDDNKNDIFIKLIKIEGGSAEFIFKKIKYEEKDNKTKIENKSIGTEGTRGSENKEKKKAFASEAKPVKTSKENYLISSILYWFEYVIKTKVIVFLVLIVVLSTIIAIVVVRIVKLTGYRRLFRKYEELKFGKKKKKRDKRHWKGKKKHQKNKKPKKLLKTPYH